jgi:hypothetical protein
MRNLKVVTPGFSLYRQNFFLFNNYWTVCTLADNFKSRCLWICMQCNNFGKGHDWNADYEVRASHCPLLLLSSQSLSVILTLLILQRTCRQQVPQNVRTYTNLQGVISQKMKILKKKPSFVLYRPTDLKMGRFWQFKNLRLFLCMNFTCEF